MVRVAQFALPLQEIAPAYRSLNPISKYEKALEYERSPASSPLRACRVFFVGRMFLSPNSATGPALYAKRPLRKAPDLAPVLAAIVLPRCGDRPCVPDGSVQLLSTKLCGSL